MTAASALNAAMPDAATADDPVYRASLIRLMRAHDTYGVWEKKSDDTILEGFVLTAERRRAIPVIGEPDPKVRWRFEVFYTALAYALTRRSGLGATPVITLSDEGFGRVVIIVGRLVVLNRTVRDVHRFGFESTGALVAAGESLLAESLAVLARFPAVGRATD